jgi:hypothetical protein
MMEVLFISLIHEFSRGNKLISSTRNQVEIKEITRNQGNHKKSRKSREIKEITRNQEISLFPLVNF